MVHQWTSQHRAMLQCIGCSVVLTMGRGYFHTCSVQGLIRPYQFDFMFLRFTYSNFSLSKKKKKKMAAWVSVTLKCRGQVLQVRHVVQCARECSFSSLLPKIDSKYEVPMFISARTKALRTLIILNEIHDYFNEIHSFFFFFFPCLPCLIFLARI